MLLLDHVADHPGGQHGTRRVCLECLVMGQFQHRRAAVFHDPELSGGGTFRRSDQTPSRPTPIEPAARICAGLKAGYGSGSFQLRAYTVSNATIPAAKLSCAPEQPEMLRSRRLLRPPRPPPDRFAQRSWTASQPSSPVQARNILVPVAEMIEPGNGKARLLPGSTAISACESPDPAHPAASWETTGNTARTPRKAPRDPCGRRRSVARKDKCTALSKRESHRPPDHAAWETERARHAVPADQQQTRLRAGWDRVRQHGLPPGSGRKELPAASNSGPASSGKRIQALVRFRPAYLSSADRIPRTSDPLMQRVVSSIPTPNACGKKSHGDRIERRVERGRHRRHDHAGMPKRHHRAPHMPRLASRHRPSECLCVFRMPALSSAFSHVSTDASSIQATGT